MRLLVLLFVSACALSARFNVDSAVGPWFMEQSLMVDLSPGAQLFTAADLDFSEQNADCFNAEFNKVQPAYIIQVAAEDDIVVAVKFARAMNLAITPRSGAHNLGGLSFVQGGVVIDLRRMTQIVVNKTAGTISYSGGSRFKALDDYLWNNYPGWTMQNGMDGHIGTTHHIV